MIETVRCRCGANYVYQPDLVGRTVKCKRCASAFVLTAPTEAPPTFNTVPRDPSLPSPQHVTAVLSRHTSANARGLSATPSRPAFESSRYVAPPVRHDDSVDAYDELVEVTERADDDDDVDIDLDAPGSSTDSVGWAPTPARRPTASATSTRRASASTNTASPGRSGLVGVLLNNKLLVVLIGVYGIGLLLTLSKETRQLGVAFHLFPGLPLVFIGFAVWLIQSVRAFRPISFSFGLLCFLFPVILVGVGLAATFIHWSLVRTGFILLAAGILYLATGIAMDPGTP